MTNDLGYELRTNYELRTGLTDFFHRGLLFVVDVTVTTIRGYLVPEN